MRSGCDVSVIIPVGPGCDPWGAIRAATRGIPAGLSIEVLAVTGKHPSRQRNLAAHRARGRVLWFLDHDAVAAPGTLVRLLAAMRRHGAAVAGGPNLPAVPATAFEAVAERVIASPVGSPFVSGRYGGRDSTGPAGERSLILCNLAIDREEFLRAGGFDPRLYPNEENALLNRLASRGCTSMHVHDAPVLKPRPATPRRFLVEAFRYGRGRMQQAWVAPAPGDLVFVCAAGLAAAGVVLSPRFPLLPLAYLAVLAAEGVRRAGGGSGFVSFVAAVAARHAAYGAGMAWGLAGGWRSRRLRWRPMLAGLSRWVPARGGMRLAETVSCRIGSMAKEAGH